MISFLQRRTVRSSFESEATLLLQEGIEITHSVLLSDWDQYADGTYFPVFDADLNSWTLFPGEETELETRYGRKLVLTHVCRDAANGNILVNTSTCFGVRDSLTRKVEATVSWKEKEADRAVSASLLILNTNE